MDATAGQPIGDDSAIDSLSFEEIVEELEELTNRMDRGDIGIEEALTLYVRAARLHTVATERLAAVRERIEALRGSA